MSNSFKFTVYTASYNYASYIETAIQSVLGQTFQDFEYIIIDDSSTDDTQEVLKEYKHMENVKIYKTHKNLGLIRCANIALMRSRGEYIIRLDGDDWLEPHALKEFNDIIKKKKPTIIYPEFYEHYRHGETVHVKHRDLRYNHYFSPHGACCPIKKSFLDLIIGYDDRFRCQDGYYLWLMANTMKQSIVFYEEPLFTYYRHPTSLSNKKKLIEDTKRSVLLAYG